MNLRDYQQKLKDAIFEAWTRIKNVLAVLPTGGGKTVLFANILAEHQGASAAIAHRQELVGQMSIALARYGVVHRVIGSDTAVKLINNLHMFEFGPANAKFYNPRAKCAVASVDTLIRRHDQLRAWREQVTLWVIDEGHHILKKNKWGKAVEMFPNAKGLGVTATPTRADGKGLGRHADGLMDEMVVGPTQRNLINQCHLTDYIIYSPPPSLIMSDEDISDNTGDYKERAVIREFRKNKTKIIGDIVHHYKKFANGKLGITFVPDVEDAIDTAKAYNEAGVPAEVITGKTPDRIRSEVMKRFRERKILQLVNVDILGEGVDVPAVEVVSLARPTESFSLFVQQCGRALRPMEGKDRAIIIDHVGNALRHAVAVDYGNEIKVEICHREWTLDRREIRSRGKPDDAIPVRECPNCAATYPRIYKVCLYCGHKPEPASRSGPEFVDGDLSELDPAVLNKMIAEVQRIDGPPRIPQHVDRIVKASIEKKHAARQEMQGALRESMAWWAGFMKARGYDRAEWERRFYFDFNIDTMSARALGRRDADELASRINKRLGVLSNEQNQTNA